MNGTSAFAVPYVSILFNANLTWGFDHTATAELDERPAMRNSL